MRKNAETLTFFIILMALSNACSTSLAQEAYVIQKATLTVYRDGIVHIKVEASISNETEPLITIPLLSSSERISNILVLDESDDPLDYDLTDRNITIYCLGASAVTLEYDTDNLTSKEAGLWTLTLEAVFELTVVLPENATIIYLSAAPSAIRTENGRFEMDLYLGSWEISYEVPIQPPSTSPPPSPPPGQQPPPQFPLRELIIIIFAVALASIVFLAFIHVRRRRRLESLRSEEIEVIRYLKERGGRALEAELRERFPYIPRTSMWRLIRRLEKQGIVQVRKVGLQNVVELK